MKKNKLNRKIIISIINIVLFIILTILMLTKVTNPLDSKIESFILGIRNDKLTNIMNIITNIGGAYSLIGLTFIIILIAIIKNRKMPFNTMINLVCAFVISHLVKFIVRRPRPNMVFLGTANGFSYPSGHTMVSFAYFVFIAYSLNEKINNKLLKLIINILTTIGVIAIGLSRLYLGMHYFTDIIAGYLLGTAYLMIFLTIRNKRKEKE